jgi:DNA primase
LADYYFSWLEQRYGKSLEGKSQIATEISRLMAKVTNAFEVDLLVRRAVDMLGIREELLRRPAAAPAGRPSQGNHFVAAPAKDDNHDTNAERSLLGMMLRLPSILSSVANEKEVVEWFGAKWRPLVDGIIREWQERRNIDVSQLMHEMAPELAHEIAALVLEAEQLSDAECGKMAKDCLLYLRRKYLVGLKRNLRLAMRAAEEQKDDNAKRERILEWQDLLRKERQLERRRPEPKLTIR